MVFKVIYFDAPGRAESTRLAAVIGGLDWEDVRLTGESFGELKASGRLPFGQVPVVEVDGKILAQSKAVFRLACKLGGLYYDCPITAAVAESVIEQLSDIAGVFAGIRYGPGTPEEKAAKVAEAFTTVPAKFAAIKKQFEGTFFRGDKPTYADVAVFAFLRGLPAYGGPDPVEAFPEWADLLKTLNALPAVQEYDARVAAASNKK